MNNKMASLDKIEGVVERLKEIVDSQRVLQTEKQSLLGSKACTDDEIIAIYNFLCTPKRTLPSSSSSSAAAASVQKTETPPSVQKASSSSSSSAAKEEPLSKRARPSTPRAIQSKVEEEISDASEDEDDDEDEEEDEPQKKKKKAKVQQPSIRKVMYRGPFERNPSGYSRDEQHAVNERVNRLELYLNATIGEAPDAKQMKVRINEYMKKLELVVWRAKHQVEVSINHHVSSGRCWCQGYWCHMKKRSLLSISSLERMLVHIYTLEKQALNAAAAPKPAEPAAEKPAVKQAESPPEKKVAASPVKQLAARLSADDDNLENYRTIRKRAADLVDLSEIPDPLASLTQAAFASEGELIK